MDDCAEPFIWNINQAKVEVATASSVIATVEIERDQMQIIATRSEFDEAHLPRVDITQPGIGAPVVLPDGSVAFILIDGTHRCVRAYREGRPFFARLLTDEAAARCVITAPEGRLPWLSPRHGAAIRQNG